MKIRNNNQPVEKDLARIYYKNNRTQNRILAAVIAISIFLLYSAFSIAYGKIRSDYLIDVRAMGTLATVSLENGSMKQYRQMEALPYIDTLGIRKTAMTANCLDLSGISQITLIQPLTSRRHIYQKTLLTKEISPVPCR